MDRCRCYGYITERVTGAQNSLQWGIVVNEPGEVPTYNSTLHVLMYFLNPTVCIIFILNRLCIYALNYRTFTVYIARVGNEV